MMTEDSSVTKRSFNFKINNFGGIPRPDDPGSYKMNVQRKAAKKTRKPLFAREQPDREISKHGKRLLDVQASFAKRGYGAEGPLGEEDAAKLQEDVLRQPHEGLVVGTPDEMTVEATGLPLGQLQQPFFATADDMKGGQDMTSDLTGSVTKYTKNDAVSDMGSSLQGPNTLAFRGGSNKRGGRGRQQAMVDYMQYSTDFAGRNRDDLGVHTGFDHT